LLSVELLFYSDIPQSQRNTVSMKDPLTMRRRFCSIVTAARCDDFCLVAPAASLLAYLLTYIGLLTYTYS